MKAKPVKRIKFVVEVCGVGPAEAKANIEDALSQRFLDVVKVKRVNAALVQKLAHEWS